MKLASLYERALQFEHLSVEEGIFLFENAPLTELSYIANELRKKQVPHGKVTWQIDRNLNTTNRSEEHTSELQSHVRSRMPSSA